MKPTILILPTFLVPGLMAQTVTHITQIAILSDLPLCLSTAVELVYDGLRTSACPQTNPSSAASCLCLKTVNSEAISMSMSIYVMIMCAGISGKAGDTENLSSGLAVFSEYCSEALGKVPITTAGATPAQTGAGVTTRAGKTDADQNDSPASSSSSSSTTSSSSSTSSSSGLSLGEKLAIGVSIPATLATIIAVYFAYKQHKREKLKAKLAVQLLPGPVRLPASPPSSQLVQQR
ncbi:hypothetical protein MBM_02920 [Drepanopeziza brunnea f. sp. 'multigermtubi' MB_m1]|uniref:Extracellular membrane protein CFEM domain-containing protein n=1 Tax=Marssonina brunnea f. sp. multigermtubi (strain MB_m1) TaxID=1072389 RepID=K1XD23_MARBU|nr:uncharacterized protein MBM_02920 [Drepanopeziza brunnea f. sp. 'multigermtubi' MB_m1]EKD18678.1 hypothetical protein MBM_02920 [Drepanopeziza brunnea f. sp. 'multigermtubi' MB_m1]